MKVKAYVETWYVGSRVEWEIEIDDDELDELNDDDRCELIAEYVRDEMHNHIEWGWIEEKAGG